MVQALLEVSNRWNVFVAYLASTPFDWRYQRTYEMSVMHIEDAFLASMVRERRHRFREVCPFNRATFVAEEKLRHCDMYNGGRHNVTWASVLVHHVLHFDLHYIHYFFQHEYKAAPLADLDNRTAEDEATAAARQWMASHLPWLKYSGDRVAPLRWTRPVRSIASYTSPEDGVQVYAFRYLPARADALDTAYFSEKP
ncbi:hypothetical protein ABL78_8408 [Leptomonas seymouri]|uniref:Uncharacterized protein n=1 Tax=Leptomonas seymouri TaxID=5684 RepID=A0A0N1IG10_LEPSE|nr:hypothetical protein ABL78_8408 [Leptomonas seymouri]|eukprot:KPI82582.1 hypothetical protein ABL78_8408 [Leptomonas seymouri]